MNAASISSNEWVDAPMTSVSMRVHTTSYMNDVAPVAAATASSTAARGGGAQAAEAADGTGAGLSACLLRWIA